MRRNMDLVRHILSISVPRVRGDDPKNLKPGYDFGRNAKQS